MTLVHEALFLGSMVLALLAFAGLLRAAERALAAAFRGEETPSPDRWPPLTLFVPVTGAPPELPARLTALLNQDYPAYQIIFATQDLKDPATRVIAALIWGQPGARLVVSGPAQRCGQKNHNLLAGLRLAGEAPEILAFCDSNQAAPPDFLRRLAAPVARGQGAVASGYHHAMPGDARLTSWGRAVQVLTLYLTKAVPRLNQPWGGATAIRRDLFAALRVDRLWAETVVDDVSLAARLILARIPVLWAPDANLATPVSGESLSTWENWLFRQWIYLKYYLPLSWLGAGAFLHLLTFHSLASLSALLLLPWGWASPAWGLVSGLFLTCLGLLAMRQRRLHPAPCPPLRWLAAFLAALFMGSWVHFKTCLTQKISWRGTAYQVDWRGRVCCVRGEGLKKNPDADL